MIRVDDVVDILGLSGLAPGSTVTVVLRHSDATTDEIAATHTMSDEHIAWFKARSPLHLLRRQRKSSPTEEPCRGQLRHPGATPLRGSTTSRGSFRIGRTASQQPS